jgi:hypothetical protein
MGTPEEKLHTAGDARPPIDEPRLQRKRPDSRRPDGTRERLPPGPTEDRRDEVDGGGRQRTWWEKNVATFYITGAFGLIVLMAVVKNACA